MFLNLLLLFFQLLLLLLLHLLASPFALFLGQQHRSVVATRAEIENTRLSLELRRR
jgi:hypothetical protein